LERFCRTTGLEQQEAEDEIASFLKEVKYVKEKQLFKHLKPQNRKKLFALLECQYVEKGQFLFQQNDPADKAYIVLHGTVMYLSKEVQSHVALSKEQVKQKEEEVRQMKQRGKEPVNCRQEEDDHHDDARRDPYY